MFVGGEDLVNRVFLSMDMQSSLGHSSFSHPVSLSRVSVGHYENKTRVRVLGKRQTLAYVVANLIAPTE